MDAFVAPFEFKAAAVGGALGVIEGYGAVFGNIDSHGDMILPGAFAAALAEHKAQTTMPALYVEHGPALGGSSLPDGVWDEMEEDATGLRVKGRVLALDTDHGKRIYALAEAKALRGLSIGYRVGAGNASFSSGAGKPKRQIKSFDRLFEVSLVTSPSNGRAQIDTVKGLLGLADKDKAAAAVKSALALHAASMRGSDSPTAAERSDMLTHLQDAHEAITGRRMPDGMKAAPASADEMKAELRALGLSEKQAADIAGMQFKTASQTQAQQAGASTDLLAELRELAGL